MLTACLAVSGSSSAAGRAQDRLSAITRLDCTFTKSAAGIWNKDGVDAQVKNGRLSVRFTSIKADEGTAEVVDDAGPSDIVARLAQGTLHFIQIFQAGALYVTTVFPKETHDSKLLAVHTRHEYTDVSLPGFTSRPEQYYGECEPR
jgi:hypothetical protein